MEPFVVLIIIIFGLLIYLVLIKANIITMVHLAEGVGVFK